MLACLSIAILSSVHMVRLADKAAEIRKTSLQSVELLDRLQYDMLRYRQIEAARALAISNGRDFEAAALTELRTSIEQDLRHYGPLASSVQDRWLADRFADTWRIYLLLDAKLTSFAERNDFTDASAFYSGEMRGVFNGMADQLERAIHLRTEAALDAEDANAGLYAKLCAVTFGALLSVAGLVAITSGRKRKGAPRNAAGTSP
jgi:hypothetical protein